MGTLVPQENFLSRKPECHWKLSAVLQGPLRLPFENLPRIHSKSLQVVKMAYRDERA